MRNDTPPRVSDDNDSDYSELLDMARQMENADDSDEDTEEAANMEEEVPDLLMDDSDEEDNNSKHEMSDMEDVIDESILKFEGHRLPVFCCSFHPRYNFAVSGGEDDRALVWHTTKGWLLFEIDEHTDSVIQARFSHDMKYLATADMAGGIYVHKMNEQIADNIDDSFVNKAGLYENVWNTSVGDLMWMRWHFAANVLFAGCETGEIFMWRIPAATCKIMPGLNQRCQVGKLGHDGKTLLAGYADGSIKLWDLKLCKAIMQIDANKQPNTLREITAIACLRDSPLYVVGDDQGTILFCTHNGYVGHVTVDSVVEKLSFAPASSGLQVLVSGSVSGKICVWDYTRRILRCTCELPEKGGISNIRFISAHIFVVSALSGNLHGFDVRSGEHKFRLTGHTREIYDLQYNSANNKLFSSSEDHTVRIFYPPTE